MLVWSSSFIRVVRTYSFAPKDQKIRIFGNDSVDQSDAFQKSQLSISFVRSYDVRDSFGIESLWIQEHSRKKSKVVRGESEVGIRGRRQVKTRRSANWIAKSLIHLIQIALLFRHSPNQSFPTNHYLILTRRHSPLSTDKPSLEWCRCIWQRLLWLPWTSPLSKESSLWLGIQLSSCLIQFESGGIEWLDLRGL